MNTNDSIDLEKGFGGNDLSFDSMTPMKNN